MIRTLTGLVLLVLVSLPALVWADDITITFNDLTEAPTVTFSPDGQTRASGSCILEICTVTVLAPVGANAAVTPGVSLGIGNIADPDGVTISDELRIFFFANPFAALVTFTSDSDAPGGLGLCSSSPSGCSIIESGAIQQFGTIEWISIVGGQATPIATDMIQFASDIDGTSAVPEPSSLLLFLLGLPILAAVTLGRPWARG